jgi:hypothetical protein
LTYYVGTTWDRASQVAGAAGWTKEVQLLSSRISNPVQVSLAAPPGAAPPNPVPGTPSKSK